MHLLFTTNKAQQVTFPSLYCFVVKFCFSCWFTALVAFVLSLNHRWEECTWHINYYFCIFFLTLIHLYSVLGKAWSPQLLSSPALSTELSLRLWVVGETVELNCSAKVRPTYLLLGYFVLRSVCLGRYNRHRHHCYYDHQRGMWVWSFTEQWEPTRIRNKKCNSLQLV